MLGNLQVLRFLAATGVVLLHSEFKVAGISTDFYGVAVFFVISGYVMCLVHDRPAGRFFSDRLWRVVPPYWVATFILVIGLAAWREVSLSEIGRSLLFIPYQDSRGAFFPVLGVGWTLNLEMYFYAIFSVAIAVNRRFAPLLTAITVSSVALLLPQITSNTAVLYYYANDYVFYFVMGIAIWFITQHLFKWRPGLYVPSWLFVLVTALYVGLVLVGVNEFVIVPLLVLTAVIAARRGGDIRDRRLLLLGAASYGCYLLHTILIAAMRAAGIDVNGTLVIVAIIMILSWTVSIVWFHTVEAYFSRLRKRLRKPRSPRTEITH